MSEYIKKEDAIESAKALLFCYGSDNIPDNKLDEYAEEFINDDDNTIVEVVRCRDCKWYDWVDCNNPIVTAFPNSVRDEDNYCNFGERKEQENEL